VFGDVEVFCSRGTAQSGRKFVLLLDMKMCWCCGIICREEVEVKGGFMTVKMDEQQTRKVEVGESALIVLVLFQE